MRLILQETSLQMKPQAVEPFLDMLSSRSPSFSVNHRAMAVGLNAFAAQSVIARQIICEVEPSEPPAVVPVQTGDVSVGGVEGADVKLDGRRVVFLTFNSKRGSALIAKCPPKPG